MSRFVNIRSDILPSLFQLNALELHLYLHIGNISYSGKYFREASLTEICEAINSNQRSRVNEALKKLAKEKLIEIVRPKEGCKKNSYKTAHILVSKTTLVDDETSVENDTALVSKTTLVCKNDDTSQTPCATAQVTEDSNESTNSEEKTAYKEEYYINTNILHHCDSRIPKRIEGLLKCCNSDAEMEAMRRSWLLLIEEYGQEVVLKALEEHTTDPKSPSAIVGWVRKAIIANPQKYVNAALGTKRKVLLRELNDLDYRVKKWGTVTLDHWKNLKEGEKEAIELWGTWEKLIERLQEGLKPVREVVLGQLIEIEGKDHYTTFKGILENEIKPLLDRNIG